MLHTLLRIATLLAIVYGCYGALIFVGQRWFIYPGRAIRVAPQPPSVAGLEVLWLENGTSRVEAWFLPATTPGERKRQPVVLFFHGNGEVIDFLPEQVAALRQLGLAVLLVEYPGYGRSGGSPSEKSIVAVARQMFLPGFLVRDVFDNRAALSRYSGPVLIFHGRYDDVVPFSHGEELARVSRQSRFVPLNCAHNDCPPDPAEFWRTVAGFLRESGVL